MYKTALLAIFAAAALAAIIYAVPRPQARHRTRRFGCLNATHNRPASTWVNNPGNLFVFAGDVFDHAGGSKVGRTGGYCMTTSGNAQDAGEVFCTATFQLTSGQITGQGLFSAADLFANGKTLPFPITGGTGSYNSAHGYATVQVPPDVPNETDANFVLHLS